MGEIRKFGKPQRRQGGKLVTGLLLVAGVSAGVAIGLGLPYWKEPPAPYSAMSNEGTPYPICGGFSRSDCVIDGDTFYSQGEKIRIADIDTPEISPPRCDQERELGHRAKHRLAALLGAGPFELAPISRDVDQYGRKLRIVLRDGKSIGDVLVAEGLARTWSGRREPWC